MAKTINRFNATDLCLFQKSGGTYSKVAGVKTCSISLESNVEDTGDKDNPKDKTVTSRSWSVDIELNARTGVGSTDIETWINYARTKQLHEIRASLPGSKNATGKAYIESLDIDAPNNKPTTIKVSMKGTGALTIA